MMFLTKFTTAVLIRSIQLIISVIVLGLSGGLINDYLYGRGIYILIISVFSLVYLLVVLTPYVIQYLQPIVLIICEGVFFIFWLISFALITDDTGSISCSGYYYGFYYDTTDCKISHALIAFTLFGWLSFIVSLALLVIYSLIPLNTSGGISYLTEFNILQLGGIYPKFSTNLTSDPENQKTDAVSESKAASTESAPLEQTDQAEVPTEAPAEAPPAEAPAEAPVTKESDSQVAQS